MAASTTPAVLAPARAPRPFRLRVIPQIDTYAVLISFVQTPAGKAVLLLLFSVALKYSIPEWKAMSLWLALMTFVPNQRRLLVTLGMLQWTFLLPLERTQFSAMMYSPLILRAWACVVGGVLFWSAVRFRQTFFGRHPIFCLLTWYAIFDYGVTLSVGRYVYASVAWRFATVFGFYLWFISYALLDRDAKDRDSFGLQLGTFRPFWGSTDTPFPKGSSYLRRIEARTPEHLAITQLKALKLLVWALILNSVLLAFQAVVHHRLMIPTFEMAFASSVQRNPYPWFQCWAALIAKFLEALLTISVLGHTIIACCRMAGFAALRNTYRPLESRTIAEFWNRYYFYFKELLVDVFFYPTFMRFFKGRSKLRLFFATLAAAGFGNAYYHFFTEPEPIARLGFWHALVAFRPYIFYCFVLASAIGISQMRKRRPVQNSWLRARLIPSLCVALFFCLLRVFDDTSRAYPIQEHFRFLAHLFNLVS
jgi:hypothetical protein